LRPYRFAQSGEKVLKTGGVAAFDLDCGSLLPLFASQPDANPCQQAGTGKAAAGCRSPGSGTSPFIERGDAGDDFVGFLGDAGDAF
jgi:hypothetical protein